MTKKKSKKVRLGISVGDINGIGVEVILKTFQDNRMFDFCTPIIYGSAQLLNTHKKTLNIGDISFNTIADASELVAKKINVVSCWKEDVDVTFGKSNENGGKYALKSLDQACLDLEAKKIDALVTAPINKNNIQSDDFNFPGHTEYLTEKFEGTSLMLMTSENIKIGVATNHIPVSNVAQQLSADGIFAKLKTLNKTLVQDFAITKPRIAVLGLNPHAGDNGLIGKEEQEVIIPAINNANSIGITTVGPYPADGFFGSGSHTKFDAVLAMYHDQGLIAFKSISFGQGVNFTAGLSAIRTSPDHGVAYEIAGKNQASETSFRHAVYLACDVFKNQKMSEEINSNPLAPAKVKSR